ncbi:VOC family protein [Micromonospora sp. NPDC047670]|uniref:VOC family protein n=1 Tax=Micromonospora sp. NPDC047670 TaxID=3364252 RepID=UPI003719DAF4
MTAPVNDTSIPDRYRYAVIPHIMVDDGAKAIDFYVRAFGARVLFRVDAPGGGVMHAEIAIGSSTLMLGDTSVPETDGTGWLEPHALGGTTTTLHVFVPDVDALAAQAESAGATIIKPPADMFHGDRTAILSDPHGHIWVFLTHLEDVPEAELRRRLAEAESATPSAGH